MWTETTRPKYDRGHLRYATDVTDAEWAVIAPQLPADRHLGRPHEVDLRGLLHPARGVPVADAAEGLPPRSTVQRYFYAWRDQGIWQSINHRLVMAAREEDDRAANPSAGVIDSQSVKTTWLSKDDCDGSTSVLRAAMNVIGNAANQECGRWLNNRAENSHQPFRRREAAMSNFRDVKTLQKFASAHASVHNHFNLDRHLNPRQVFKQIRSAALAEWRQIAA